MVGGVIEVENHDSDSHTHEPQGEEMRAPGCKP